MKNTTLVAALSLFGLLVGCGSEKTDTSSSSDISSSQAVSSSGSLAPGNVIINEIVSKSVDPEYLEGNDWIEIANQGPNSVDLSNYAIADSGHDPVLLPSITLVAGEYVVIAAVDDEDLSPPALSVPFKLGSEDAVYLYFDGQLIDSLVWSDGDIPDSGSYGWLNDQSQALSPTPGVANAVFTGNPGSDIARGNPTNNSALIISEVVPKSDRPNFYDGEDWFELRNTGTASIQLSEYSVTDSESPLLPLPEQTLEPGDTVVVVAGGTQPEDGSAHVTFKLGREDSLSLYQNGVEVRFLEWEQENSKNGRSYGYLNDQLTELYPTPNYDNVAYVLFNYDEVYRVDIDITSENWQAILANPTAEQYYPVNFELNGAKIENVGFRTKGQGSLNFVQNSTRYGFKVDMNEYVDQKFMGMKKLVFNQSFSDPSFMRDNLSYKLLSDAGVPAPQITYVDLWIAGQHQGLYQMVEMIDTEFLEKHFPEDDDDLGDLYKGELGQRLQWVDNDIASYSAGLRLKTNESTIGTPEEGLALLEFLDAINNSDAPLEYINVDSTLRYLAASVLIGNMDNPIGATANNFYLYEQRSQGVFTLIPWDYNLAMGMWGDGPATTIEGGGFGFGFGDFDFGDFDFGDFDFGGGDFGGGDFSNGGLDGEPGEDSLPAEDEGCRVVNHVIDNPIHDTNSARPMFDPILQDPVLREQYHQAIQQLLDTVFNPTNIRSEINRMAALIDPYVQADPTKFFTYDEWLQALEQGLPEDSDISSGRGADTYGPAPGIVEFVTQRSQNVQQQLSGMLPSSNNGGTACPP